mmetsp:Transcript_11553/g.24355  ORF Transcript_11553/g.24355 Transcript_11553/m.24355 type:complete len:234 (-) Transcript_11553:456-1157(-)
MVVVHLDSPGRATPRTTGNLVTRISKDHLVDELRVWINALVGDVVADNGPVIQILCFMPVVAGIDPVKSFGVERIRHCHLAHQHNLFVPYIVHLASHSTPFCFVSWEHVGVPKVFGKDFGRRQIFKGQRHQERRCVPASLFHERPPAFVVVVGCHKDDHWIGCREDVLEPFLVLLRWVFRRHVVVGGDNGGEILGRAFAPDSVPCVVRVAVGGRLVHVDAVCIVVVGGEQPVK